MSCEFQFNKKRSKKFIRSVFVALSVQFSHSVMYDSLWPHGLQHAGFPCFSPFLGAGDDWVSIDSQSCLTLCDAMDCSMPGPPVHLQLMEFTQTHVHWVGDAIQPSHPLSSASPPSFNLSQHQGLFKWVSSSHQVAKVLEFQLQHQSFQWTFRTDFL